MSTSAILPISSIDYGSSSASSSQQRVFNSLLNQLQQSIGNGDLTNTATLLNAIDDLSPSSAGASSPLGTFLTSLGTAISDGSLTEAQSALSTYQSATPTSTTPANSATSNSATAANVASGLIQSQIQFNLVSALLNPDSSSSPSASSANGLLSILNAAYGASNSTNNPSSSTASTSASTAQSPYETLVSSLQASLDAGNGTTSPALAYLQASGNFVNTTA